MKTTLNQIKKFSLCDASWRKLLKSLNKTKADDEPLTILHILDSNGLDDALWCLKTVKNEERKIRLFMVFCARKVQHLMPPESVHALDVSERFANGLAPEEELAAARAASSAALSDAASAASWASRAAASDASDAASYAVMAAA